MKDLYDFAPRLVGALQRSSILTDVNSDMEDKGLETSVAIDRDTAARLGVKTATSITRSMTHLGSAKCR